MSPQAEPRTWGRLVATVRYATPSVSEVPLKTHSCIHSAQVALHLWIGSQSPVSLKVTSGVYLKGCCAAGQGLTKAKVFKEVARK